MIEKLIGEVIGFRQWHMSCYPARPPAVPKPAVPKLRSTGVSYTWKPGVNKAYCIRPHHHNYYVVPDHPSPCETCFCGLYGMHSLDMLLYPQTFATGLISAWGKLQVHNRGFRAEYAKIVALILFPRDMLPQGTDWADWDAYGGMGTPNNHRYLLNAAAERYQVPLIRAEDVKTFASEFGQVISKKLRPGPNETSDPVGLGGGMRTGYYVPPGGPPTPAQLRRRRRLWLARLRRKTKY